MRFNMDDFPEIRRIQENVDSIKEELLLNKVWLNWASDAADISGHCQFLGGAWTVCPIHFGNYGPENILGEKANKGILQAAAMLPGVFPSSHELLKPLASINYVALSRLHAKSRLAPHRHNNPRSLIAHVALKVPADGTAGLFADGEDHIWSHLGQTVIFDDNLDHGAWNDSGEERIVLYVDFKRP